MRNLHITLVILASLVAACSSTSSSNPDAAVPDAALTDGASPDASLLDAALTDAASPDAALTDAASPDAGPPAEPECTDVASCSLHTDCCNCVALAPGETPPPCDLMECFVTACAARGMTEADLECGAGRCVAGYDCDPSTVLCDSPTPVCAAGEVPSVVGACWGACVPVVECAAVPDCGMCDPAVAVCVSYVAQLGPVNHCVALAPTCGADQGCECLGPSVCLGGFDVCVENAGGLTCECPAC